MTAMLVMQGFHDPKKFPPLKKLLDATPKRQTPAQQRSTLALIAQAYNLKLRKGKKKDKKKQR